MTRLAFEVRLGRLGLARATSSGPDPHTCRYGDDDVDADRGGRRRLRRAEPQASGGGPGR